jgi:hypothetical protein
VLCRSGHSLIAATLFALNSCSFPAADKYAGRDGKAEANEAFRAGRPARVYTHVFNGFYPGWVSPGLELCSPETGSGAEANSLFKTVPELAFQESVAPTSEESRLASSAGPFALAYNQETFRLRRKDLARICPEVRLDRNGGWDPRALRPE